MEYFKCEIIKFYSESGQKEMLCYLCAFIDRISEVDKVLQPYYLKYIAKIGVTEEKINAYLGEIKENEKLRDFI